MEGWGTRGRRILARSPQVESITLDHPEGVSARHVLRYVSGVISFLHVSLYPTDAPSLF